MPTGSHRFEVISVSLPQELVKLAKFLDSIARKQLEREYAAYYAQRSAREKQEERDLLAEWALTDDEAWAILKKEEARGPRAAR
jgi:hypothetical protein